MPVSFTSREALAQVLPGLGRRQRDVWECIRDWEPDDHGAGPSIEDLAHLLSMKESSVCGRIAELLSRDRPERAAIEEAPVKHNRSGMKAKTYRALDFRPFSAPRPPPPQQDLFGEPAPAGRGISPYQTSY